MISVKKDFDKIPEVLLSGQEEAWRDKSVLDELKKIYHGKCAYCEQKTEHLQIDHYRPKNKYPWLKNEWSNLLPACPECHAAKGSSFPIAGRPVAEPQKKEDKQANSKLLLSEKPLLIHPEVDTAENHFYFEKNGIIQGFTERGRETIQVLNLNRNSLIQKRQQLYQTFFDQLKDKILRENRYPNFYTLLLESTEKKAEFSLLGIQLCYQFEDFLLDETLDKIEERLSDGTIKATYSERHMELTEYYEKVFNVYYNPENYEERLSIPFSILSFSITKFQGIKNLTVDNIPLNTQWIFLTGENGFGKTSILKAVLLGLIGKSEFTANEIDENSRIVLKKMEQSVFLFESNIRYNLFGSYIFSPLKDFVAAYGSKRTDFIPDASEIPISDNLFERTDKVLNTEQLLKTLDGNEKLEPFKEVIIEAFRKLIPRLSKIEPVAAESVTSKKVLYYEKDENGNELSPVTFNELAMGMRSIIGLVGDIIQRLSSNRHFSFPFETSPKNSHYIPINSFQSLSDLYGIVIIDELDNHLHPSWQRMLVKKLTEVFPKVQFIVATHSPVALLGAPPDKTVILNVNRTKEEGITVRRLEKIEKELKYLLPNQLLTSDIFGLDEIENIYLKDDELDKVPVEDNYEDIEKNKELMEDLERRANDKELFPDDLFSLKS